MAVHGYSVHDELFDYEICSLLCLPCIPTKEMVVYVYLILCSIEVWCIGSIIVLIVWLDKHWNNQGKINKMGGTRDMEKSRKSGMSQQNRDCWQLCI